MATTWYVSLDTGNDTTGNGTVGNPYKQITKAASVGSQGDTIMVASSASTYTYSNGDNMGGYHIKGIDTPSLASNTYAMIDGLNSTYGVIALDGNDATTTFENIYMKNHVTTSKIFTIDTATGYAIHKFVNCIFDKFTTTYDANGRTGFFGKTNVSVTVPATSITILFDGCTFIDFQGSGSFMSVYYATTLSVTFRNCTFSYDSTISTFPYSIVQGSPSYPKPAYFYNCVIDNRHATTLYPYRDAPSGSFIMSNNISRNLTTTNATLTANITGDPLFVDLVNKNFRLKPNSPARNIGDVSL